jgi:hypothetical protein
VTSSLDLINLAALPDVPPRELLAGYEVLLRELRRREVVRTNDAPSGQYAEWLAQRAFGGVLAPNSVKSYDLTTDAGRRLQVKARVIRDPSRRSGERQLSPFRSFDFDDALIILFDTSYDVSRGVLLAAETVLDHCRESRHVNGHVLIARDSVLDLGTEVTREMNSAS